MIRERLGGSDTQEISGSEKKEDGIFERKSVASHLEGPHGERTELRVALSRKDGELRGTNFWDLDKTLLVAEPIHATAVERIFPEVAQDEAARKELHRVYFDGFTLGNSFREWDRMW